MSRYKNVVEKQKSLWNHDTWWVWRLVRVLSMSTLFMSSAFSLRSHKALCQSSEVNITPDCSMSITQANLPSCWAGDRQQTSGHFTLIKNDSATLSFMSSFTLLSNNLQYYTNTYLYYKGGLITELVIGLEERSTGNGWRTIFYVYVCVFTGRALYTQ